MKVIAILFGLFAVALRAFGEVAIASTPAVTLSQQRAVQAYPDLATPGSKFNKAFLAIVNAWKVAKPEILQRDDWPERAAAAAASELGTGGSDPASGTRAAAMAVPPVVVQGSVLTIADLVANKIDLAGKVVRVKLNKPLLTSEQTGPDEFRIYVEDKSLSASAFVYFPREGVAKMDLLSKTTRSELTFYVEIKGERFNAVGRLMNNGAFAW